MSKIQSVVGIQISEWGRVLLLKRYSYDRTLPGKWVLPGGKIDKGETHEEALIREVKEETNLDVTYSCYYTTKSNEKFDIHFYIIDTEGEFKLNTKELETHNIFTYNDIPDETGVLTFDVLEKIDMRSFSIIQKLYRGKSAKRSGVPYMNHIVEGLCMLNNRKADIWTRICYTLHPIVQNDVDLVNNGDYINRTSLKTMMYIMEYRKTANYYLPKDVNTCKTPLPSPLNEVNKALLIDKLQNQKDFNKYHKGTHPNSDNLEKYFDEWIELLSQIVER